MDFRAPKNNKEYWEKKIENNKRRDHDEQEQLAKMGWHCITIWECSLKKNKRQLTLESLAFTLNRIFLIDHSVQYQPLNEEPGDQIAAEPLGYQ